MKLAVITDEVSQDLGQAIELARRHGCLGIEIRSVWNTRPHDLTTDQCARIREEASAAGLELVAYDSPVFKHALPRSAAAEESAVRLLERSLAVSRALGNLPTRIFSFYRDHQPQPEAAAEAMATLLDRVSFDNVPLIVENGMRSNTPTVATLRTLLHLLHPRDFPALWDPGNAVFSGCDELPALDALKLVEDRIALVHVKDPVGSRHYTRLGHGDVPWPAIISRLTEVGFSGFLSLETHWRLDRTISQAGRDEPWGELFSHDGYEPSAICLAELRTMALAAAGTCA